MKAKKQGSNGHWEVVPAGSVTPQTYKSYGKFTGLLNSPFPLSPIHTFLINPVSEAFAVDLRD